MNDTETQAKYVETEGRPTPPDWPERPPILSPKDAAYPDYQPLEFYATR